MRKVNGIVYHYSATLETMDIGLHEIRAMHVARGWKREGYNEIIRITGQIEHGRPWDMIPAGVAGHNSDTLHICCIGGLRKGDSKGYDTRTPAQIKAQIFMTEEMLRVYPHAWVKGHNELASTQCPGYSGSKWWIDRMQQVDPPVISPTVTRGYLELGKSNVEVLNLKKALQKVGFHALPITSNYFGSYTRDQVIAFQSAHGLDPDGKVGPMTWTKLIHLGGTN